MGNCGITLTSATRVFLMEPCLDPGHEVQCAGRIHRLGQTKDVLCKRYCMKGSYEEAVCKMHDKIKAGTLNILNSFIAVTQCRDLLSYTPPVKRKSAAQRRREARVQLAMYRGRRYGGMFGGFGGMFGGYDDY